MGFFDFFKRISKKQDDMVLSSNVKEFEENKVEQNTEEKLEEVCSTKGINIVEAVESDEKENKLVGNGINTNNVLIEMEGYAVEENSYIKVKNVKKVYTEGTYVIGTDIEEGEYYFWGDDVDVQVKGKEKYDIYGGLDECIDTYVTVEGKGKVIIEQGYMTHIDNIIYTYSVADKLIPGHVYRVDKEIPHGKYYFEYDKKYDNGEEISFLEDGQCAFDMREKCYSDRIYRESGKEGVATTDELVKCVIIFKGSAILKEEGLFPVKTGPKAFHKKMEMYAIQGKINEFRNRKLKETSKIYKGNYVCFYFSIIEPLVEIILDNILLAREKCNIIPNLSEDDFSRNYVVMIDKEDVEKQCIMLYLFMEKKIETPKSFGIALSSLIHSLQYNNLSGENYEKAIAVIEKNVSTDIMEVLRYYSKIYPYCILDTPYYYDKYLRTDDEYGYLYYRVCNNREEYAKKYSEILLQLAEKGIISKKWRNEFDLYLMTKSYYPDAKYQYHDKILDKQSLDIFIPSINMGLEYQGIQHYQAVDFFGGEERLEERKKLDASKREKCKQNGILLVEWEYTKDITDSNFVQILREHDLSIPEKIVIKQEYLKEIENEEAVNDNKEVLFQYSLGGVFVSEFASIDEAVEKTGINKINIQRACSGFRDTAGGYQWRKVPVETLHTNIEPVVQRKSAGGKRAINQYDMDGNFIKRYESLTAASTENAINSKSIRDAANNKQRHAGGYVWKYEDEV